MTLKLMTKDLEGGALDLINDVREQLNAPMGQYMYVVDVMLAPKKQEVIACEYDYMDNDNTYWSIPYTMNDQDEPVVEMDRDKWEERELDYVPVGSSTYSDIDDDEVADDKDCQPFDFMAASKAELDSGKGSPKRSNLKKSEFAYVDEKGVGHFPIQDAAHVRNALARLDQSPYGDKARKKVMAAARRFGVKVSKKEAAVVPTKAEDGFMHKISSALTFLRGRKDAKPFYVTKDANGRMRFFCAMTNNFMDREKELFTASSHKSFIKWCDDHGSYPELWAWHAKGSEFGVGDWLDFVEAPGGGGIVVMSGLITPGYEERAEYLAGQDVAMSHGFIGHRTKEGYWTEYVSWEASVLPRGAVANYGTAFNLLKEENMPFTAEKAAFLRGLPGATDASVKQWEAETESMAKNLKAMGISYKELGIEIEDEATSTKELVTPGLTEHMATMSKAMSEATKAYSEKSSELEARVKAAEDRAEAAEAAAKAAGVDLKTAVAQGVKDQLMPRAAAGQPASESTTNVLDEAKTKEVSGDTSWLQRGMAKTYDTLGVGSVGTKEVTGGDLGTSVEAVIASAQAGASAGAA